MSPEDHRWVVVKPTAALGLQRFQFSQRAEDQIDQWPVRKRPELLGELHRWQIRKTSMGKQMDILNGILSVFKV